MSPLQNFSDFSIPPIKGKLPAMHATLRTVLFSLVLSFLPSIELIPAEHPVPPSLRTLFHPPESLAVDGGAYRSPLRFDDGSVVASPEEWDQRRREILRAWHEIMGPWPSLLEQPAVKFLETVREEGFIRHRVQWQMARDRFGPAYLLVPDGQGPFPAVVVPFYDAETSIGLNADRPFRDFGRQLARRGFVTLNISSPGGDAREPDLGGAACQPLSYLAYIAANARHALAVRPDVDERRIGIVGHSYGGKWAMFAACLDERFACGVWSDPGIAFDETRPNVNYWERWYLGAEPNHRRPPGIPNENNPRTGAYRILREQGRDLHELQSLMAPRPFLVSGGAEDGPRRWQALHHVVQVNAVLGAANRVAMSNRPDHAPNAASNELIYDFLEHVLKPPPSPSREKQ